MKALQIYQCLKCNKVVEVLDPGKCPMACCGEDMELLEANTKDAATEKHVPVITRKDGKIIVKVGSTTHPMTPEHWIQWIALVTDKKVQRVDLTPADEPKAEFVDEGGPVAAYEFCNLHGLWKAEA